MTNEEIFIILIFGVLGYLSVASVIHHFEEKKRKDEKKSHE